MQTPSSLAPPSGAALSGLGAAQGLEAFSSAVSWGAIIAGAATASAVSLLLLAFGAGIGLASVSPWPNAGATATTFAISTAIWLIIVQWIASGMGGYLTGRLRTKWTGTHSHEVFFRDTAHGFLAWSVATLMTAVIVASASSSLVSGGAHALAGGASGASQGVSQSNPVDPTAYLVDTLFRSDKPDPNASTTDIKAETTRILVSSVRNGAMNPADRTYLAQLVAARTGVSQQDAEKRVDAMNAQAKAAADRARAAADAARKAGSQLAFFTSFSMLIGAFIASVSATLGGQQRDEW